MSYPDPPKIAVEKGHVEIALLQPPGGRPRRDRVEVDQGLLPTALTIGKTCKRRSP